MTDMINESRNYQRKIMNKEINNRISHINGGVCNG